ncbi:MULTISPECIES: 50S ribosomal protein L25/general stress protein Ctc [Alteromonadaceae]|uniref:50S ribosomal protein L25/general stress protein Ctc n=1 Tax=Alteromonadaceae TaxID=72275 RepID=UPI001C09CCE3|nr:MULTISPECIES: 50S ribosomal protein L25/general stress protein Ctc [Aliiglaciecola]MBU2880028.1 50S ribosomal protein L25/general stress protein Ctc [Aliiglaciecola lipolytica]MDO6710974.1 50S ribosomal protein L25/general stress protein Ctc [Aliiglaciecola sp. 2_MG-2023]MDO6752455.1 50S ribosomal protein L25/general stress protein Ctc [Aliiglaciecola sp. 1_MG-2023]
MSDAIFNLDAEVRSDLGKGASRRLRREDKVPAILYGAGKDPVSLTLAHNKVIQAQEFEAFYSHVLTLNIAGEKVDALVKDMQRHPFKPKVTHIDFLRVDKNKEVTTNVPLHFINEDKAEAIKTEGGHAEHHMNDVEVTCLPGVLPEFIEVNLESVGLGETVHLSDLVLPEGVVLVELAKGESHDLAVATIKTAKGPSAEEAEEGDSEEAASEE